MKVNVVVETDPKFDVLYNPPPGTRVIILIGGRGGKKTYEVSKAIPFHACIKGKKIQLLRDEATKIKKSILSEVFERYDTANENGAFDGSFIRGENEIKAIKVNPKTGVKTFESVVFTQGFRASSNEKTSHMKGVANVDIGVVEEMADIRDMAKFLKWQHSVRQEGSFVIMILNTPDIYHWVITTYFNIVPVTLEDYPQYTQNDIDGYYKLVPKKLKGVHVIQTSYKNNEHLPKEIVDEYESSGIKGSPYEDIHYFLTEIEGLASTGKKGQYFKRYKMISLEEYLKLDMQEVYGQDFGTRSPAAIVGAKAYKNKIYVRELNYEPLDLLAFAFKLDSLGITEDSLIIADSAEPKTIGKLRYGLADLMSDEDCQRYPTAASGFTNIRAVSDKGIMTGLSSLLSKEIYVVEGSDNIIKEFALYCEGKDMNGNPTGKPIDDHNHCFHGETIIKTDVGSKFIKDVRCGMQVYNSGGWCKVVNNFNNGWKEIREYKLIFENQNIILKCTADHKIKTSTGWIEISKLKDGMTLFLYNTSMTKHSDCTKAKGTFREVVQECTQKFGNFIMGKYQKDSTYITKTKTHIITVLKTLNVSKVVNILARTCLSVTKRKCEGKCSMLEHLPTNGMEAKQVGRGIKCIVLLRGLIGNIERLFANFAERNTKQDMVAYQSIAIKTARLKHLEIGEKTNCIVYDLQVEKTHEYLANGVLVHNCIDTIRYINNEHGKWF
jgi:hypothetical protein